MANENMIKFLRGNVATLPQTATSGALYFTKDEGIYMGMEDGSYHRYGDFITVADVESLPATGAHATCMYYCTAENILARYDSAKGWIQINKQPTAEEMKTLLGLGSMAYKSEVAEGDLSAALKEKVNAAAEGNHSHSNKGVLDGITADKVSAWDNAEKNAKDYADDLDNAMNTRVEALEAIDHEHANKAELDLIASGDKAKWDTAAGKAHEHTFVESELNKIADGDVAKWNAVVADHLDSEDETALKNLIKEAKQAGTDANTNIESYKVTNDARVKAVEDDVAEIVDGENGILAQAKSYSDGKLATARTEISAEIDTDVKAVADELAGYKSSNDTALAGVKATAEAAAVKTEVETALAGKVDKVEGKSLVSDTEITKLAGVSEGANKVEASVNNGSIKIDGVETVVYTHPDKHTISDVTGLQDALDGKQAAGNYSEVGHKHVKADITDFAHTHVSSEITDLDATIKGYDYATKTELGNVDKKFENYKTAEAQKAIDDEQDRRLGVIEGDYLKAADIANFETKANVKKVADDLAAYVESNDAALAAETKARTDVDAGFETRIAALEDNFGDGEGTVEAQIAAAVEAEEEARKEAVKGVQDEIDAMYTNAQIDGFIADAKKYADDNDADTKYGIVYDSDNKKIKLVEGGTDVEIDASAFIKDGMINTVTIDDNDDLIITFNTDAGKENIVLPLDQLVDIYTGVEGDRIKVTVNADKSISADLVAGSITKDYLDAGVKASLARADSAIQSHQDISHLATTEALNGVDAKFDNYTNTTDMNAKFDLKADKTQVATDIANAVKVETDRATGVENGLANRIKDLEDNKAGYATTSEVATAKQEAITEAGKLDAALKTELQKEIDNDVKTLADTVYTKDEVDAMLTWGSF